MYAMSENCGWNGYPMVIKDEKDNEIGGFGIFFIVLVLIILAIGALNFKRNDQPYVAQPVVQATSPIADLLPALMVAQTDRDVLMENCRNRELVLAENAKGRELTLVEGAKGRELTLIESAKLAKEGAEQFHITNANIFKGNSEILQAIKDERIKSLEDERLNDKLQISNLNTQLLTVANFAGATLERQGDTNAIIAKLNEVQNSTCQRAIPAYVVPCGQ